ncbi:MAG: helix-turn-helix transcriptional regulator [Bacteroidota bacterium]
MPHIKNALIRYRVIDKTLRNTYHPYPTKQDLRLACEETLYGDASGSNICDSTIEKDLFAMREEHDAPIKYSKKEKGYFYEDPDFTINEIPLSEDDIESIQFALSTLSQFRDTDMFKQFGFALDKIVDRVNVDQSRKQGDIEGYVQFERGATKTGNEHLAPLLNAIKTRSIVYFDYESFISQNRKKRKVSPLLLKEYNNRWYLISYDYVKQDIITYGLDRLFELEVTEQDATIPENFDPDLFFKYSVGITASKNAIPEKIIFEANAIASRYIDSQPFHESQQITSSTPNGSQFTLFVVVSEELIRKLMSYAGEIKVLQPNSLAAELKKRAAETIDRYNED